MAPFLTIADAAERLGVSSKTVRRLISAGRIPAFRVGRLVRIKPADLDAAFERIPSAASR
jgi:excisionase family DNA binding protein